jgi:hypothetical protein
MDEYEVISDPLTDQPPSLNWSDELNIVKRRPIHRYSREERFKFTLAQLMGCSGDIPNKPEGRHKYDLLFRKRVPVFWSQVEKAMPSDLKFLGKRALWESIRNVLKQNGWRLYYNRIPSIMARLGLIKHKSSHTRTFQKIMQDFQRMDRVFGELRGVLGRTYFPNLRYVAVRLMERHRIQLAFTIPRTRTLKKQESLDKMYDTLWEYIIDKDAQEIEDFFN